MSSNDAHAPLIAGTPRAGDLLRSDASQKGLKMRVLSLDALRGVAITLMILANYGTGGPFNHSPWNGLSLADLAMPLFVFSMGCAIAFTVDLSSKPWRRTISRSAWRATKLVLLGWVIKNPVAGHWDFATWRLGSVLGRLGLCYFITSCIALVPAPSNSIGERNRISTGDEASAAPWLDRRHAHDVREDAWRGEGLCGRRLARQMPELADAGTPRQCAVVATVQFVYLLLVLVLHAPGCPAGYFGAGCVHANSSGTCLVPDRDSATNTSLLGCSGGATGYIDRQLLGPAHMRRTTCAPAGCEGVDPNGVVAVLPSVLHVFIGLTIGRAIRFLVSQSTVVDRSNDSGGNCAQPRAWVRLLSWASICAMSGGIASVWLPINKLLWSLSYVFFTSAIACVLLAALHWSIDERQLWRGGVFRAAGVNPIVLYLGSEVFGSLMDNFFVGTITCKIPSAGGRCSLKDIVLQNAFEHAGLSSDGAHACYGVLLSCFWLAIGYWLDRSGVHITL